MKNLLDIYLDLLSKWKEFYKQYGCPYIAETAVLYDSIESFHPRLEAEMPINEQDPKSMIESIKISENRLMPRVPEISSKNSNTDGYCVCLKDRKEGTIHCNEKDEEIKSVSKEEDKEGITKMSQEINSEDESVDEETQFECSYCHKRFKQKGNMNKHIKLHLFPNVEQRKKFKCEICGRSYTERYNYKVVLKDIDT